MELSLRPERWANIISWLIVLLILAKCDLQGISPEMKDFMLKIKKKVVIGIVGGSDYDKIQQQMGGDDSK